MRHDAEDAFQAVFLVLANRARSIRRKRFASQAGFSVSRNGLQRGPGAALLGGARGRRTGCPADFRAICPFEQDTDWEILHEEVDRLPERLRAPLVLCYLEGRTYDAAAHQLAISDGKLRGRLAQARKQLRSRLTRRGVTVPLPAHGG